MTRIPSEPLVTTVPPQPSPKHTEPATYPPTMKIAIVIDDMGANIKNSERALQLPAPITLSFLPFTPRVREQAKRAKEAEHEILLHLPMEPLGKQNPGRGALLVGLPGAELQKRIETALSDFTGYDGVNNHMGSKFTASPEGMALVVDELKERNLFFLDSRTSGRSVGLKTAREKNLPAVGRDVFLDDSNVPETIRRQLKQTEAVARLQGFAIAIGHPRKATLDALEEWIPDVSSRGFVLVPLNTLVEGSFEPSTEEPSAF